LTECTSSNQSLRLNSPDGAWSWRLPAKVAPFSSKSAYSNGTGSVKTRLSRYILGARPLLILAAPVIYSLIIPFVLLDLFISAYQLIWFPLVGIPSVRRGDYMVIDRVHLAYLNVIEKANCMYCSYANGLIAYVREIASLTEQYWCPIKHARRVMATHERYRAFVDYGDAESYHTELAALREELRGRRDSVP